MAYKTQCTKEHNSLKVSGACRCNVCRPISLALSICQSLSFSVCALCLSVLLTLSLSLSLSVSLSQSIYLSIYLSLSLSLSQSSSLSESICVCLCLSITVFFYHINQWSSMWILSSSIQKKTAPWCPFSVEMVLIRLRKVIAICLVSHYFFCLSICLFVCKRSGLWETIFVFIMMIYEY